MKLIFQNIVLQNTSYKPFKIRKVKNKKPKYPCLSRCKTNLKLATINELVPRVAHHLEIKGLGCPECLHCNGYPISNSTLLSGIALRWLFEQYPRGTTNPVQKRPPTSQAQQFHLFFNNQYIDFIMPFEISHSISGITF